MRYTSEGANSVSRTTLQRTTWGCATVNEWHTSAFSKLTTASTKIHMWKNPALQQLRAERTLPQDRIKRVMFTCKDSERCTSTQKPTNMENLRISLHRIQRRRCTPQAQNSACHKPLQHCRGHNRSSNVKRRSAGRVQTEYCNPCCANRTACVQNGKENPSNALSGPCERTR